MKFLSPFIDKLQATFPPNRICILLAGPIVAAAAWIAGLVAANIPGVELPVGIVAGIIGAAVLIVVTLIYKWFDQWQASEPINVDRDLEDAYAEIVESHGTIDKLLGTGSGVLTSLDNLLERAERGEVNEAEILDELKGVYGALGAPHEEVASGIPADVDPPTPTAAE